MRSMIVSSKTKKLTIIAALIAVVMVAQGCVLFLSTVAAVVSMRSSKHYTTTVLVNKKPPEVYAAMLRILEKRPDVKVISMDDKNYLIEASRGNNYATAKAAPHDQGMTQLVVTADAGEQDQTDEDLALNVVKMVCEELGIKYKVVES